MQDADRVAVEVVHDALRRSGRPLSAVARDLGLVRKRAQRPGIITDNTRLKRMVGLAAYTKNGARYRVRTLSYNRALEVVMACGFDPVDFGL